MGVVSFTALRSPVGHREPGEVVALEVDLQDAIRSRRVRRQTHRSSAGEMEALYEGADTEWALTFEPVAGLMFARVMEFLNSTAGGEEFLVWVYGTEAAPIRCWRADEGYSPQEFLLAASRASVPYVMQFTAIEAAQ